MVTPHIDGLTGAYACWVTRPMSSRRYAMAAVRAVTRSRAAGLGGESSGTGKREVEEAALRGGSRGPDCSSLNVVGGARGSVCTNHLGRGAGWTCRRPTTVPQTRGDR